MESEILFSFKEEAKSGDSAPEYFYAARAGRNCLRFFMGLEERLLSENQLIELHSKLELYLYGK